MSGPASALGLRISRSKLTACQLLAVGLARQIFSAMIAALSDIGGTPTSPQILSFGRIGRAAQEIWQDTLPREYIVRLRLARELAHAHAVLGSRETALLGSSLMVLLVLGCRGKSPRRRHTKQKPRTRSIRSGPWHVPAAGAASDGFEVARPGFIAGPASGTCR